MVRKPNSHKARSILIAALGDFCDDFNRGLLTPILEADVAGYLYHRIVSNGCPINMVYLATRVRGDAVRSRKPDIVIGELDSFEACVDPLLIAELKVFQRWGHSDQQMRHRFTGLIGEDLPTLQEARSVISKGRFEIVVDLFTSSQRRGYLMGTWDGQLRKAVVANKCREIGAEFLWIRPENEGEDVTLEKVV